MVYKDHFHSYHQMVVWQQDPYLCNKKPLIIKFNCRCQVHYLLLDLCFSLRYEVILSKKLTLCKITADIHSLQLTRTKVSPRDRIKTTIAHARMISKSTLFKIRVGEGITAADSLCLKFDFTIQ